MHQEMKTLTAVEIMDPRDYAIDKETMLTLAKEHLKRRFMDMIEPEFYMEENIESGQIECRARIQIPKEYVKEG